jgi:hypothetical protein
MFTIGRREHTDEPGDALRACHERIRKFLAMAVRLASDEAAPVDDVWAAAGAVARYFDDALPLHERDEDESIAPRLTGVPEVATMRAEHVAMRADVLALIAACEELASRPLARDAVRPELARVLAALAPAMDAHLAAEERAIFPALDALPDGERAAIKAEMVGRRSAA